MEQHFQNNVDSNQFELIIGDQIAFVEYFIEGNKTYLTHTEVPVNLQGQGIGSKLANQTLQYLKKNHGSVVPQCSFVAHYIDTHPQWHSILPEGYQM